MNRNQIFTSYLLFNPFPNSIFIRSHLLQRTNRVYLLSLHLLSIALKIIPVKFSSKMLFIKLRNFHPLVVRLRACLKTYLNSGYKSMSIENGESKFFRRACLLSFSDRRALSISNFQSIQRLSSMIEIPPSAFGA